MTHIEKKWNTKKEASRDTFLLSVLSFLNLWTPRSSGQKDEEEGRNLHIFSLQTSQKYNVIHIMYICVRDTISFTYVFNL